LTIVVLPMRADPPVRQP